jgi:hypothetical protein
MFFEIHMLQSLSFEAVGFRVNDATGKVLWNVTDEIRIREHSDKYDWREDIHSV